MAETTYAAGDPIEARCTKCRKITNHIIVAVADEVPVKVECNTCKGQHKYRKPAVRKTPVARRTVNPKLAEQKEWEKLRPTFEDKPAIAYTMETAFKAGSVMNHPVFGLGLVQKSIGSGKVEVLFADGLKKMRCL